jgi:protein-tyrosine phosphatase
MAPYAQQCRCPAATPRSVVGLQWVHLPIPDVCPPDHRFEAEWAVAGPELRRIIRRGGSVLVHCRGGLGRAGTVAARLLVELGMEPAEAIAAVRQARSGRSKRRNRKGMFSAAVPPRTIADI